ncbi:MAG: hypothetical protein LV477_01645, partial [Candidatus Nitrosotalea sp.]|nr:hypothetical protein [Candidatus Nitrosotalea sp.]
LIIVCSNMYGTGTGHYIYPIPRIQIMYLVIGIVLILFLAAFLPHHHDEPIPKWVKKNAKLWHDGKISDDDFVNGIKWSVENKVIPIRHVMVGNHTKQETPKEFKNISYFWSIGLVSDKDYVSTIRYLIKNDVIKMDYSFVSKMNHDMKNVSVFNETRKSVVIIPVLTSSAYSEYGFYAHYRGECKACLTIKIRDDLTSFTDSSNGLKVLKSLGYNTITDIDIDKNPHILEQYDKVIVLHNEYVTQREFDAITGHKHVMYLYPNALYAKVTINYWNDTVTLVRGHGYPDSTIRNGFDWKFDNSKFEYDRECNNWSFHEISNGMMLDCYPEGRLDYDMFLLQALKEF